VTALHARDRLCRETYGGDNAGRKRDKLKSPSRQLLGKFAGTEYQEVKTRYKQIFRSMYAPQRIIRAGQVLYFLGVTIFLVE
jgi:hypothetical protein